MMRAGRMRRCASPDGDAADLVDRPADQLRRGFVGILFGGGGWFAWWRIAASMAKASMTNASMTSDT